MKILVVGSGGREHAIAWKCAQSLEVDEVIVAPGNAGTHLEKKLRNINIPDDDIEAQVKLAKQEKIDLTIVGPETPLTKGIVDRFEHENQREINFEALESILRQLSGTSGKVLKKTCGR